MARERTLLSRIAATREPDGAALQPTTTEDLRALMDSVRDNLARLLNSRQGMSEALPDYGLPAMADLTFGGGDDARRVEEAIRMAVEKYEPRLRRIRVSPVVHEDAGQHRHSLSFRIDATLRGASGEHRVWYETEVRGTGEFDVLS